MMRLVDADTLSEKLCETTIFIKDGEVFQRMINDAPTIDAVEVVRCGECRHIGLFSCPLADNDFQKDDDYCSWGERREEGRE